MAKCKWVMEIEGLGISFNLLNSKLIARNEAKPKEKLHERKAIKNVVAPQKKSCTNLIKKKLGEIHKCRHK